MKTIITFYLILFLLMLVPVQSSLAEGGTHWFDQKMSLNGQGRPLKTILEEVAAFFQTDIQYISDEENPPIQCHYKNATLEEILKGLFRRKNQIILFNDDPQRKVTVQIFGKSKYINVTSKGTIGTELPFGNNTMPVEELAKLQSEKYQKHLTSTTDQHENMPGTNITKGEFSRIQANKHQNFLTQSDHLGQLMPGPGPALTLQVIHDAQTRKNNEKNKIGEDAIVPQ